MAADGAGLARLALEDVITDIRNGKWEWPPHVLARVLDALMTARDASDFMEANWHSNFEFPDRGSFIESRDPLGDIVVLRAKYEAANPGVTMTEDGEICPDPADSERLANSGRRSGSAVVEGSNTANRVNSRRKKEQRAQAEGRLTPTTDSLDKLDAIMANTEAFNVTMREDACLRPDLDEPRRPVKSGLRSGDVPVEPGKKSRAVSETQEEEVWPLPSVTCPRRRPPALLYVRVTHLLG
jgi:hypothetical protein